MEKKEDTVNNLPPKTEYTLFGKNLAEIPCFKNSYLYGVSTGIASGFVYFMFTSKPKISSHVGVTAFTITCLGYWTICRYNWDQQEKQAKFMKEQLKDYLWKEGVESTISEPPVSVSYK